MNIEDKQALLNGSATIKTKIIVLSTDTEPQITLTEEDSVKDWDYEDFRQVRNEGWIGQFVAKQVTLNLKKTTIDFKLENREFELQYAIIRDMELGEETWYSLGNFLVTEITKNDVTDCTKIIALDYCKKFNVKYIDTLPYPCTLLQLATNICEQAGVQLGSSDIRNKDYLITGNVFKAGESLREVAKAIGKTSFSWVRIGTDNKLYFDYTVEKDVSSENNLDNNTYYTLKTQNENFGVVNRVVIGYKNIDGEQTKIEDKTSIEKYSLCEITVFDNPLVYTQEQREQIINSAQFLLGLTYRPCSIETIGHPWLTGKEALSVSDMDGNSFLTYAFDRTISYFGHIKTKLKSVANTKTDTKYAYEPNLAKRLLNAEIRVDKELGKIIQQVTKIEEDVKVLNPLRNIEGIVLTLENSSGLDLISFTKDGGLTSESTPIEGIITYIATNGETTIETPIDLQDNFLAELNNVKDVLRYEDKRLYIDKKIGRDSNGYYILDNSEIIDIGEYRLQTLEGNCTIKILSILDTNLTGTYTIKNPNQDVYQTKDGMFEYYTKDETNAQIITSVEGIEQTVSNVSQIVDNNGKAISQVETQVKSLQTNTELQIETIMNTLDNGVETLKNSLVTINVEGIKVSTNVDKFMSLLSNKFIKVTSGGDEVAFFGYDSQLGKTIARIPELETERISSGYHRWDSFIDDVTGEKRSGWFYKGV